MTNVAIQTAVEMENLRIDLEQQNTILETKAIRELGLGVVTPALVNLIIEIYTNKTVLVAMNRLKNGIQPEPNDLITTVVNLDRSPVMLRVITENQLLPTIANNALIKLRKMQQDAQQVAMNNVSKQTMRGNNMYIQQPMQGGYMMGQPMQNNGLVQPIVTQPMGMQPQTMYPNMMPPMQQPNQSVMSSGVYSGKYANAQPQMQTMQRPVAQPQQVAPDRYAKNVATTVQQPKVDVPVEALPSEEGSNWLCAPGVSININGDAIGSIERDLTLTLDTNPIEGNLKTNDLIKAGLFNTQPETMRKCNYLIKKRQFTTSDKYKYLESRLLSYYTAKANVAFYYMLGRASADDVVQDRDTLMTEFIGKIVVIKDRAEAEDILNKAIEETQIAKANISTENSPIDNLTVEINYEEVRPTYVLNSDRLLEAFVGVKKAYNDVISLSRYSYPGVYKSLSKLLLENNNRADIFIASVKGYVYATLYQKDAQSDITLAVIESKIK